MSFLGQAQIDRDNDGMPNDWEIANGLDECDPVDAFCDNDGDQVVNLFEYELRTGPNNPNSPMIVQVDTTITDVELADHIKRSSVIPTVIRMAAGTYPFGYREQFAFQPVPDRYNFMMQGGWDADFCDYDPFVYKTILDTDKAHTDYFLQISNADPKTHSAYIFDGIQINQPIEIYDYSPCLIFSNCILAPPDQNPPIDIETVSDDETKFYFINSSLYGQFNNIKFDFGNSLGEHNENDEVAWKILNSSFSDFTSIRRFIGDVFQSTNLDLDVKNSIVWDTNDQLSFQLSHIPRTENGFTPYTDVEFSDSNISPWLFLAGNLSLEENNVTNVDPELEILPNGYQVIGTASPLKEQGKDIGLPFEGTAPDIGVNAFAYSNFLVEDVIISEPSCDASDGVITLTMQSTNKQLEFSINDLAYQDEPRFEGLAEGEYLIRIRTVDNCAHFQQKVTLSDDCPGDCDLSLEDSDNDGMPNDWEIANGLDECDPTDAFGDLDCDQVWNLYEYQLGSDPYDQNSPLAIWITNTQSLSEIQAKLQTIDVSQPLVIRFLEGLYDGQVYTFEDLNNLPSKVMFQGGWSCTNNYDPFAHRTIMSYAFSGRFDPFQTVIYDGFELEGVGLSNRISSGFASYSNCAFYLHPLLPASVTVRSSGDNNEVSVVNCSFVEVQNSAVVFSSDAAYSSSKLRMINTTITSLGINSSGIVCGESLFFSPDVFGTRAEWDALQGTTDVYIKDCNLWDVDPNSRMVDIRIPFQTGGTYNLYLDNSNISRIERSGVPGDTEGQADLLNLDPLFDNTVPPYFELSTTSPLISTSTENGFFEEGYVGDIGSNQNFTTCYAGPGPTDILTVTGSVLQPVCNSANGSPTGEISITTSGGVPGYSYQWLANGDPNGDPNLNPASEDQLSLGAGTFSVTVTDVMGCTGTSDFSLVVPPPIEILASINDSDCSVSGEFTGSIMTAVSGGVPPYSYSWSTADGHGLSPVQANQEGLSEGSYQLVVTDAVGCQQSEVYVVDEASPQDCPSPCDFTIEDADNDGMPNDWELANNLDPCDATDAFCDNDGDHVINLFEFQLGTDPYLEGSPVIVEVDSSTPFEQVEGLLMNSGSNPVVIRMAQGDYDWRFNYGGILGTNPEPELSYNFLFQGGWDNSFCDMDPFIYKSRIESSSRDFFNNIYLNASSTSNAQRSSYVFEGLVLDDTSISVYSPRDIENLNYVSIYNCSLISSTISADSRANSDFKYRFINNSSIEGIDGIVANNRGGALDIQIQHMSRSDGMPFFTEFASGIYAGGVSGSNTSIGIENSIMWDDQTFNSVGEFHNGPLGPQTQAGSNLAVSAFNSVLSDFFIEDRPAIGNWTFDTLQLQNINPQFTFSDDHYNLPQNSDFREAAEKSGIPSAKAIPDLGVNQFAYSTYRLVDTLIVEQPSCNLDNGSISIEMLQHHKDFEFSLNTKNNYGSTTEWSDLAPGDYVINIRTSDNCAHFQQKVTLVSGMTLSCTASGSDANVDATGGTAPYTYIWNDAASSTTQTITGLPDGIYTVTVTDADDCTEACSVTIVSVDCDPALVDSDNDGMPNAWEIANGLDECDPADALCDPDGDQVINLFEYQLQTDPYDETVPTVYEVPAGSGPGLPGSIIPNGIFESIVVRFEGGTYGFVNAPANTNTDFRVMLQGGWSPGFTEYDPFTYPTILNGSNTGPILEYNGDASGVDVTYILDGMSFNRAGNIDGAVYFTQRSGESHFSFYNCVFEDNIGDVDIDLLGPCVNHTEFINCAFTNDEDLSAGSGTGQGIIRSVVSQGAQADWRVLHTTMHRPGNEWWNGLSFLVRASSNLNLDIINSNIWSGNSDRPYSVRFVESTGTYDYSVVNSNLSPIFDAGTGFTDNPALNIDPLFDPADTRCRTVSSLSALRGAAEDYGVSYRTGRDLGINKAVKVNRSFFEVSLSHPSCGENNGEIRVEYTGFIDPSIFVPFYAEFSIDGVNFQTSVFDSLSGGTYNVWARSYLDNCVSYLGEYTLEAENTDSFVKIEEKATCGEANGSITIMPPGNIDEYEYAIVDTTNFQSSNVFSDLPANVYVLYYRPVGNPDCIIRDVLILNQDSDIALAAIDSIDTSCGKNNGAVELQVEDAEGAVSFSYAGGTEQSSPSFADLEPGLYTFLVEDTQACKDSVQVTIEESEGIAIVDTLITQPTCNLDNGQIEIIVNDPNVVDVLTLNGVAGNIPLNSNLAPLSYNIVVTDIAGCSDEIDLVLSPSEAVEISDYEVVSTNCGQSNGSIIINATNGDPTSFSLDGMTYVSESDFLNLDPGTYDLIATNVVCADTIAAIVIADSEAPTIAVVETEATSCGDSNGSALLDAAFGLSPYTYIVDGQEKDLPEFGNLEAGSYFAYVVDSQGCKDSTLLTIGASEGISLMSSVTNGVCGNLGQVELSATGGSGDYTYAVGASGFQAENVFTELEELEYLIQVQDAGGCSSTAYQVVLVDEAFSVEVVSVDTAYCNEPVGAVDLTFNGGSGSVQYFEEGSDFISLGSFDQLAVGLHTFIGNDLSGCIDTVEVLIPGTPPLSVTAEDDKQLFCGEDLTNIDFEIEGGTGDMTVTLFDNNNTEVDLSKGIKEGNYLLRVEDALGCVATEFILVQKEECAIYIPTAFNPSSSGEDSAFMLGVPEQSDFLIASFKIYDRWGSLIYNEENIDPLTFTDWWDGNYNGREVEQGVYVYVIQLSGEKQELLSGTVTLLR